MSGLFKDSLITISIDGIVKKYKSTVPSILAAHTLTGCDSGPKLYYIGSAKTINSLKSVTLSVFGNLESWKTEILDDVKRFIAKFLDVVNKHSPGKQESNVLRGVKY